MQMCDELFRLVRHRVLSAVSRRDRVHALVLDRFAPGLLVVRQLLRIVHEQNIGKEPLRDELFQFRKTLHRE